MRPNPRILIIDDEPLICRNCAKILSKSDYEVRYALNGYDALKMMDENRFQVVITDLKMSRLGGMEVLARVKENYPDVQVIVITGYASVAPAVEVMKMGACDYLPKPFTPEELRSTVEKALSGEIQEAPTTEKDREQIDVIDIDIPFDREEVARVAGDTYADTLGPSDMPVFEVKAREPLENFYKVGDMVCDIFKKLGATCKAGVKTASCPQKKAKKRRERRPPDLQRIFFKNCGLTAYAPIGTLF